MKMKVILNQETTPVLLALSALVPLAVANERLFTYTYDTRVLPMDVREVEVWTTLADAHDGLGAAHRLELELPVTERLLTAFYVNASADAGGLHYDGISSEWKLNLLSPDVHPVGVALYAEVGLGPDEVELEGKLLADHQGDKLVLAGNLVVEHEWEGDVRELILETDTAAAWRLTRAFAVGVEGRTHTERVAGEGWEHMALFVGPSLAYASTGWWAAASVAPQLGAWSPGHGWGMDDHEHSPVEARLLVGVHL